MEFDKNLEILFNCQLNPHVNVYLVSNQEEKIGK